MSNISNVLNEVKLIIQDITNRGDLYDSSQVEELLSETLPSDVSNLKSEVELIFLTENFSRFHNIYVDSLLWFLIDKDKEFVLKISKKALNEDSILNKEPWVSLLEELNELESIALFFKQNPNYGDRFFQEKLLYILSKTNIEIGDQILHFLNNEYEIISLAALTVIEDQNLKQYFPDLINYFKGSKDADILVKVASILIIWGADESKLLINYKIDELIQLNFDYYSDSVKELKSLLRQTT